MGTKSVGRKPRILSDSREQAPLSFNSERFELVKEGVPFGDYWCEVPDPKGDYHQIPICIERKGIGDLFGTMGKGYERFKKEMKRCEEAKFHMVLAIEGTFRDVENGYQHSSIKGESMVKKLGMLQARYGLEVHYFECRRSMSRWIEELFDAVHRNYSKAIKEG